MRAKFTGIILTGGKSSRMEADKAQTLHNGKMLIEYAIESIRPLCNQILISSSHPKHKRFGFPVVEDEQAGLGPIMGLYSSLKMSRTELNLILGCDMPNIATNTMAQLSSVNPETAAVFSWGNGKVEPLAGVYSRHAIPFMEQQLAASDLSLMGLLRVMCAEYIPYQGTDAKWQFKNTNRPEDIGC